MPRMSGNAVLTLNALAAEEASGGTLTREERKAVLRSKRRAEQARQRDAMAAEAGEKAFKAYMSNPSLSFEATAQCDNGVTYPAPVVAVDVHPVPRHNPPTNPMNAAEYQPPMPPCRANGCGYCNTQRTNYYIAHLRTNPYQGGFAMLANEERTLNRRLTWFEFKAIFNHFAGREKPMSILGYINLGSTSYPKQYHHDDFAAAVANGACTTHDESLFLQAKQRMARSRPRLDKGLLHYIATADLEQRAINARENAIYGLRGKWEQEDRMRSFSEQERVERLANARAKAATALLASYKEPADVTPAVAASLSPAPRDLGYCDCSEDEDGNTVPCGYCVARNSRNARDYGRNLNKSPNHGIPVLARPTDKVKRLVGLEVEFNQRVDLSAWILKWSGAVHSDGSCGWEAVTTPIGGSNIDACMRDLSATMREKRVTADNRCGVHVHVDASDVKWVAMRRLIKLYAKVEPILYMLGGQQRTSGQYCHIAGDTLLSAANQEDYKSAIMAAVYNAGTPKAGKERQKERPGKKDGGRYKGLNIVPWLVGRRKHAPDTTVEFRMHRNCLDARQLTNWAKLCAAMVEWAVNATDRDVEALPRSALRTLCQVVAPPQSKWILGLVQAWRHATTASNMPTTTVAGTELPGRLITLKNGVFSCAV